MILRKKGSIINIDSAVGLVGAPMCIPYNTNKARGAGSRLINESPVEGAGDKKIAFLHPKSTMGVLTEFCTKECL